MVHVYYHIYAIDGVEEIVKEQEEKKFPSNNFRKRISIFARSSLLIPGCAAPFCNLYN